jgi:hypothetical protein
VSRGGGNEGHQQNRKGNGAPSEENDEGRMRRTKAPTLLSSLGMAGGVGALIVLQPLEVGEGEESRGRRGGMRRKSENREVGQGKATWRRRGDVEGTVQRRRGSTLQW